MIFWIRLLDVGDAAILYFTVAILLVYIKISLFQKRRLHQIIALLVIGAIYLSIINIEQSRISAYSLYILLFVALATIPWSRAGKSRWKLRAKEPAFKIPLVYGIICLIIGW